LNRVRRTLVECVQRALSRAGEGIAETARRPTEERQDTAEKGKERRL
jgi:hypothetical protein